jgi:hypothetical protein
MNDLMWENDDSCAIGGNWARCDWYDLIRGAAREKSGYHTNSDASESSHSAIHVISFIAERQP